MGTCAAAIKMWRSQVATVPHRSRNSHSASRTMRTRTHTDWSRMSRPAGWDRNHTQPKLFPYLFEVFYANEIYTIYITHTIGLECQIVSSVAEAFLYLPPKMLVFRFINIELKLYGYFIEWKILSCSSVVRVRACVCWVRTAELALSVARWEAGSSGMVNRVFPLQPFFSVFLFFSGVISSAHDSE